MPTAKKVEEEATTVKVEEKKKARVFKQTDPILCRSVTPGWLGVSGKSGMYYVFSNYGDEAEIEYGDLFALKNIINIDGSLILLLIINLSLHLLLLVRN